MIHVWTTATRQFRRYWVSSVLMVLGSSIGVLSIVLTLGSVLDVTIRTYEVEPNDTDRTETLAVNSRTRIASDELYRALQGLPGVVTLEVDEPFSIGPTEGPSGTAVSTYISGESWHPPVSSGRYLNTTDFYPTPQAAIVIGSELERDWFSSRSAVGKTLNFTLNGELRAFTVAGVLGVPGKITKWDRSVVIPSTFDVGRKIRTFKIKAKSPTELTALHERVIEVLSEKMPDVTLGAPKPNIIDESTSGRSIIQLSVALAILVLVVSGVNCGNLASFWAQRRRREIGIRLALGATRWEVVRMVLIEVEILNVVGSFLGLGIYALLYPWIKLSFEWVHVLVGLLAGMISGLVAGSVPAVYIAKLDPADALKAE